MRTLESNRKFPKLPIIILAAGLLIFLVIFSVSRLDLKGVHEFTQNSRVYVFSKLNSFGFFISEIKKVASLIEDNSRLKEENKKLLSQLAFSYDLSEENDFLRDALGLDGIRTKNLVDAKAFNIQFTPEGHFMLVNKGVDSGVKDGDIVISSSGVLIGQVVETSETFSKVSLITNSNSKITVKVLRNQTAGIARGYLNNGLIIDFISQEDDIVQDDILVTTGNDIFPPGLIVGTVSHLGIDDSNIFRKVTAKAEISEVDIDRLLIIRY